jgi:Methylene-tetrahydromethanopterin dehydrogenase, N-terminal.
MKDIMLLFDTDRYVTPFDILIAYDSGFDIVVPIAQVEAKSVTALTQDAMFPRGVKGVGHTTIFVGGKDVDEAKKILKNVKKSMFPPFEISIIVDPRGGHTTASALVAKIDNVLSEKGFEGLKGKR